LCYLLFCINVFISLRILQYFNIFINKTYKTIKVHLVRLLLLCYSTQGGTGGVSFANKNVSGLQKYLRFQSGNWTSCRAILDWNQTCDNKSHSRFAVVRFCNHAFDFSPNCTPLSSITIMNAWWYKMVNFN
jgi:hypothetical protein